MSERVQVGTDLEFVRYLKENGGDTMKKCYQCATCSVVCELSPKEYAFPRKEMIQASWGLKDKLMSDPDIWLCHGCMDCSLQCPRSARPADLMGALRSYVYRAYAFPGFMGKALASPKYLPALFLAAALFVFVLVIGTNMVWHDGDMNFFRVSDGQLTEEEFLAQGGTFKSEEEAHHFHKRDGIMSYEAYKEHGGNLGEEEFLSNYGIVQYTNFINKISIQATFIPLNFLIFFFAFTGYRNYWMNMKKAQVLQNAPKMSFVQAAWCTLMDLFRHKNFDKCPTNSNRRWGHIYVFWGFMGTMIATGIVVLGEMYEFGVLPLEIFHFPYPMGIFHPVKVLGMISGIFLFIGMVLMFAKRLQQEKREGRSTYNDWLFLVVLLCVALTGILTVALRLPYSGEAQFYLPLANIIYFLHLTFVFFLLVYMPWSKFAHMLYRYVGLVFLKLHGRENKPEFFSKG